MRASRAEITRFVVLATLTTAIVSVALLLTVHRGNDRVAEMLAPAASGPSARVFRSDFPSYHLPDGRGHDGQAFYTIARQPMHLRSIASDLDRPRYRLQRILFPLLAWAVEPQGAGKGLAIAMYVIASIGVALTGIAGALLARVLGASQSASERIALLFPVLPLAMISLDICTPDALALGLVLLALALDAGGNTWPAVAIGILAFLTRETSLLVLGGWCIARGRRSVGLLVIPAGAAALWWLWLRITVPDTTGSLANQFDVRGLAHAVATWSRGHELLGAATFAAAVVLAALALRRAGPRSPLGPAIILQLAFVALLIEDAIGPNYNGPRAVGPLLALSVIALATAQEPTRHEAVAEPRSGSR